MFYNTLSYVIPRFRKHPNKLNMSEGFKELYKLAKTNKVKTYDELVNLTYNCSNEITGADLECVRQQLRIKMF